MNEKVALSALVRIHRSVSENVKSVEKKNFLQEVPQAMVEYPR